MSEREILFRGKRVDNGEWIDGWFLPGNERQSLHPCIFVYPILGRIPPLLSEAKVGDECRLFFTETIDNQ